MLYPKLSKPLDAQLFREPTAEYRGTPFWAWNCKLEKDELLAQIDVLRNMGYGGFHMHVRTGMATDYLSDEYMELVKACVEKARGDEMLAWLYDEDRWPSGAAGGIVTKNKEHRIRHLLLTRVPYGQGATAKRLVQSKATSMRTENGVLLACYDVALGADGSLARYRRIGEHAAAEGFKLYAYMETAEANPWFNNQAYADTLNPETIQEFIRVTYDRYHQYFAKDFGGVVPAIFTDEPQFSHKTTLDYAQEARDVTLPWTPTLPETYQAAYGADVLDTLPELLWEIPEGASLARYRYHDHISERFAQAFADQCGDWCKKHNLMLTGHMMEEPTLYTQTMALGEAMRSYRGFQLPGIDMLCNRYEYTTAKQAQSACHQHGNPGVMSELYGVTNWDFDFRGHKVQGDWQAALGVTVRVPHLSWVSMNGEAKRDYPGTFNYQAPWHGQYKRVEDHFARVNTAMTRGKPIARIGVIHPIESYWLHWGAKENTRAVREQKDEQFKGVTSWLLEGLMDFDFICESLLPGQCDVKDAAAKTFPVGKMRYDVVIVPGCETLRKTTLDRLEAFHKAGGRVLFMGDAPIYEDVVTSARGQLLYDACEHVGFERIQLLNALEGLRELDIRDSSGSRTDNLFYQLRDENGERWLFVAHCRDPKNKDLVAGDTLRFKIRGEWALTLYDTMSGQTVPLQCEQSSGWTILSYPFYDHDSLLLKLTRQPTGTPVAPPKLAAISQVGAPGRMLDAVAGGIQRFLGRAPVTLSEPNVLLLDLFEYALDSGEYRPLEEILKLDNQLRKELDLPLRMEAVAQPWVENDESTPHTVRLRAHFDCALPIAGAKLALERPDIARVRLNGADIPVKPDGWYVDKCIVTIPLPELMLGGNVVEVEYRYGRKVDLECLYLIGDFSVRVDGCCRTLGAPVRELAFGDITRQGLPFYGGNIVYHLEASAQGGEIEVEASSYRGSMLSCSVGGLEKPLIFAPYRATFDVKPGVHKLDINYYGCRVNTFGQLHNVSRAEGYWWGPNSWRSVNEEWTYEYKFWEQGVLKSPEVK